MEKRTRKFLIGFDRYVQLDWCGLTLEAAIENKTTDDVKDQISRILSGTESRRKTFDILKRLWIQPIAGYEEFSKRGVELYRKNGVGLVSPLSWGSAMVTYPFFGKTAEITGRLLSIQGDCSIKEVQRRMAELYGDRDGIARAVSRVLQSQRRTMSLISEILITLSPSKQPRRFLSPWTSCMLQIYRTQKITSISLRWRCQ